jgi:hypothetical protein
MSSFWDKARQSFSTPAPQPAQQSVHQLDETSKAILDIENKKRAITQASGNEQNSIKAKIDDEYRKIGETSYALYADGNFEVEKITVMFETVKGLHQLLEEKQVKLNEILSRYDEELTILRPAPPAGQEQCPGCGAAYIPGEMLFCSTCGGKLPEKTTDESESASADGGSKAFCSACGEVYSPGVDMFCIGCGSKLG